MSITGGDFNGDGKPDLAAINNGGESVSVLLNVTSNAAPVTISGQVTSAGRTPISGVMMTLAGSQVGTTSTDANGNYTFTNLAAGGTYAVTPTKKFYRFNPTGQTFNSLTGNQRSDFVATLASFSIAGRVTDSEGMGISGVTISLGGSQSSTATTNATGTYSFFNLMPGGITR